MQNCKHVHICVTKSVLSYKIASTKGGCVTLTMLPSLHKPCHPTKQHLLSGSTRKDKYPRACWLNEAHGKESMAFSHRVHSQQGAVCLHKRCMAVLICKWKPAVQYTNVIESIFRLERRERGKANALLQYFIGHLPCDLYGIQKSTACGQ